MIRSSVSLAYCVCIFAITHKTYLRNVCDIITAFMIVRSVGFIIKTSTRRSVKVGIY